MVFYGCLHFGVRTNDPFIWSYLKDTIFNSKPLVLRLIIIGILQNYLLGFEELFILFSEDELEISFRYRQTWKNNSSAYCKLKEVFAVQDVLGGDPEFPNRNSLKEELQSTATVSWQNLQILRTTSQLFVVANHLHRNRLLVVIQNMEGCLSLRIYENVIDIYTRWAHLYFPQFLWLELPIDCPLLVLVLWSRGKFRHFLEWIECRSCSKYVCRSRILFNNVLWMHFGKSFIQEQRVLLPIKLRYLLLNSRI